MKTAPTNKKVRELISMVKEEKLIPRPEFQRRLVWSRDDKNHFLDSVLRGYPFPEIYFADGDVNLDTGEGTQQLVDGLQRVSTLIQYFEGDPELKLTAVLPYSLLSGPEKMGFLQYDVAVRDLGTLTKEEVIEVFRRLNATKYSLTDIEINNARYSGALKKFCERTAEHEFFREHAVFSPTDYKRMGDLRFVLSVVCTMLEGYFNRDDAFEDLLSRFNDEFWPESSVQERLNKVIEFIEECNFFARARIWKKADLFTAMVELDSTFFFRKRELQPFEVLERIGGFLERVDEQGLGKDPLATIYYKSALQASNDRINRVRRGVILGGILNCASSEEILEDLVKNRLIDGSSMNNDVAL